jgi:hypothetical protein
MATYPAAVRWSLAGQDFELDTATGAHVEAHPIDAAVTLRLGFRRGTLAGDPTTGHTLLDVDTSLPYAGRQEDILRRQIASLGDLVTGGLVSDVMAEHEFTADGRLLVSTHYRNTKTGFPGTVISG